MRRYWKRWVGLLVFVAVLGTAFILLGRWQLNRLAERKHNNAIVIAHENSAPIPFAQAFHGTVANDAQWARVQVTGRYDDAQTLQIRYRSNNDKASAEFVTPFHADDGRTVLVDRGYAPDASGQPATAPAAPTGTVTLTGYIRRDEQGPANARVPQNRQARLIDAPAIGTTLPYPIVDGYLSLSEGTEPGLQPVPTPTLDEGPHLSYALQWFSFCAMALLGLFVFIRGDIREARKAKRLAATFSTDTVDASPGPLTTEPGAEETAPGADPQAAPSAPADAGATAARPDGRPDLQENP